MKSNLSKMWKKKIDRPIIRPTATYASDNNWRMFKHDEKIIAGGNEDF